ncbi:MAG: hypothetical protein LiPW30_513 [Parcubacteria group bacterium LiPW_30]|nr:MAG: hypothetical protein LiPW30_513 [Parcubacteria group bacterium LiPW_30]
MFSLEPQFFDIFGFVVFVYITLLSWLLLRRIYVKKWMIIVLFLIGVIGLLVDGSVVYVYYLKSF